MKCAKCGKELQRGLRRRINGAPKMARFCFECWRNWLAGFWAFKDTFVFANGGWNFDSPNTSGDLPAVAGKVRRDVGDSGGGQ